MGGPLTKAEIDREVQSKMLHFQSMSYQDWNDATVLRALRCNYTSLVARFIFMSYSVPSSRLVSRFTELIYITHVEAKSMATSLSSASTAPLQKNQDLPYNLSKICREYQKASRDILRCLITFLESDKRSLCESQRNEIKHLYVLMKEEERGVLVQYYKMTSSRAFEEIARKAKSTGVKISADGMITWFIVAITGRRKLRDWYDRLPKDDPRFEMNPQHEHWLQTLVKVANIMLGRQQ